MVRVFRGSTLLILPSRNPHRQSAVHGHGFAGDVIVLHEHQDGLGHLFRRAFAMERDALFEVQFILRVAHRRVEGGADDAGGDAVDEDVVVGEFTRERAGELR